MKPNLGTLRDIKIHQDIYSVIGPYLPEELIDVVFTHMRDNKEDLYDHEYLRNSLVVAKKLVDNTPELSQYDRKALYAIVTLLEVGRPLSTLYPYDLSGGVGWMFLRLHAREEFTKEDLRFITQSCRPLNPHTQRPSLRSRILLIAHNTKRLTDVVSHSYEKIYKEFLDAHGKLGGTEELNKLFLEYYGSSGNLWPAISASAKALFSVEIAQFKREVRSVVKIEH